MKKIFFIITVFLIFIFIFFFKTKVYKQFYSKLHNHIGYFYYRDERLEKAIKEFQKALKYREYSNVEYVYYNLGLTYQFQKEFQKAIDAYQMAYALNPDLKEAKFRIDYLRQFIT